VQDKDIVAMED